MKAAALFGAGWENASLEVLWQAAGRAFCRLGRDGPEGDRHAFIPLLSGTEHPTLESITDSRTETNSSTTWTARGHCRRWTHILIAQRSAARLAGCRQRS